MTKRQWKSVGKYIRTLADQLWLRDWNLEISHNPADGANALAQVTCTPGRKQAVIELCPNFPNLERAVQRHVLVHELLHVAFSGPHTHTYQALPTLLGEAAWSAYESGYRMAEELATDGVADAIAPLFPLWEDGNASHECKPHPQAEAQT